MGHIVEERQDDQLQRIHQRVVHSSNYSVCASCGQRLKHRQIVHDNHGTRVHSLIFCWIVPLIIN